MTSPVPEPASMRADLDSRSEAAPATHTLDTPGEPSSRPLARKHRVLLALGLVVFLGLFAYLLTLATDPHSALRKTLEALLERVRDPQLGLLYVLLAYALGAVVFAPITLLFGATTLALASPVLGFSYALLGGLTGASVSYWIGRLAGAGLLRKFGGKRLNKLATHVQTKSFRSVLIARFLPVGNFTLINLFLGSMRVPFVAYLLANVVGMLPSLLGLTLLADQVQKAMREPSLWSVGRLVLAGLAVGAAGYGFSRALQRRVKRHTNPPPVPGGGPP